MNKQENFVFDSIYKGGLASGSTEKAAKDHALMGLYDYRKSRFNPRGLKKINCGVADFIQQRIEMAKRER